MATFPLRTLSVALSLGATACFGMLTPRTSFEANPQLLALPPVVVFQGSGGSLSYHAAVGRDGQRLVPAQRVQGRACQRGIQLPILAIIGAAAGGDDWKRGPGSLSAGWGEGGYQAAIDDARRQLPEGAILYDVQADLKIRSILTIYREQCVLLDAGVLVPAAGAREATGSTEGA